MPAFIAAASGAHKRAVTTNDVIFTRLDDPRYRRKVERLYGLGPRPVGELFAEIVCKIERVNPEIADFAERRLEKYADLDADTVRELGGSAFPLSPIRAVRP